MSTTISGKKTGEGDRAISNRAPRRAGRLALFAALAAVPVALSACSSASALSVPSTRETLPASVVQGGTGLAVPTAGGSSQTPTPTSPARTSTTLDPGTGSGNCSISAVASVIDQSSAQDQQATGSWTFLQANGWTVPTPSGDWHLSASAGGFDAVSPDGGSGADLSAFPSQTPWTISSLAQADFFNDFTNFDVVCSTQVQQSVLGPAQAYEFTGDNNGVPVHGIVIFTLLNSTQQGIYYGQVRDLYTPTSQWSTANAQTLILISKLAIESPSTPSS